MGCTSTKLRQTDNIKYLVNARQSISTQNIKIILIHQKLEQYPKFGIYAKPNLAKPFVITFAKMEWKRPISLEVKPTTSKLF